MDYGAAGGILIIGLLLLVMGAIARAGTEETPERIRARTIQRQMDRGPWLGQNVLYFIILVVVVAFAAMSLGGN